MLALTRKVGEKVCIDGGRIVVTVIGLTGGHVQLGIEAPADVEIHRKEVQQRIDAGEPRPTGRRDGAK